MKKDILRSSFFRVLEIVIVTIVSLALTPYLIKHLDDENYGLWLLIMSTLGWFNFIDLGFSAAVKREIAFALEKKNMQRINVVFSVSVVLFGSLGLVAASGIIGIALFPEVIGVSQDKQEIASVALGLLALKVLFDFIMNSFHGFFAAYIRMDIDANLSLLNTLIKSALVFVLIKDMNIYGAVAATLAADAVTQSLKMYFARRLNNGFVFSLSLVNMAEVLQLFSYSKHVILTGISRTVQLRADPLIISHFLSLKFVAIFGVVLNLANQIESFVKALVGVFSPVLNRLVARNKNIENTFFDILSINAFVAFFCYTLLAILSESFIQLWIGNEYSKYADLAILLGFSFLARAISRPIIGLLMAQNNHQLLSLISTTGAFVNIIMSILMIEQWGLYGVAVATAVSFFLSDVILPIFLVRKYNSFSLSKMLLKVLYLFVGYVLFVYAFKTLLNNIQPINWLQLFYATCILSLLVGACAWFLFLSKNLRFKLLKTMLNKNRKLIEKVDS